MAMISILAAALLAAPHAPAAATLHRVMKKGDKEKYQVRSHMTAEVKPFGIATFIPEDVDLNYDFTTEVLAEKADGIVDMKYSRPTMTQIDGETADSAPKTHVEKVNMLEQLTVSPINEILEHKDLNPKKPDKPGGGGGGLKSSLWARTTLPAGITPATQDIISSFIQELQRLTLFIGGLDSALDFQPKMPFQEVEPGATWKRTVSYSPQKLKSKDKTVMQRLDYVYTYKGLVDSGGKQVHRVTAVLDFKSDLVPFLRDNLPAEQQDSVGQFKEVSFEMKANIDYDLDPKTCRTLLATATSKGGFRVIAVNYPDDPLMEQKLFGRTQMKPGQ